MKKSELRIELNRIKTLMGQAVAINKTRRHEIERLTLERNEEIELVSETRVALEHSTRAQARQQEYIEKHYHEKTIGQKTHIELHEADDTAPFLVPVKTIHVRRHISNGAGVIRYTTDFDRRASVEVTEPYDTVCAMIEKAGGIVRASDIEE